MKNVFFKIPFVSVCIRFARDMKRKREVAVERSDLVYEIIKIRVTFSKCHHFPWIVPRKIRLTRGPSSSEERTGKGEKKERMNE